METSAIMENRIWRLPQGLRRAPVRRRCPPMRFFGRVQVLAGAVTLWALIFAEAGWAWWALALFGCFLYGCVGLSVGFHRYFAHRSFEAPRWAVVMFHLLSVLVGWRTLLVDGYKGGRDGAAARCELRRDRFGAWQHRHYLPLALACPILLLAQDWLLAVFGWGAPVLLPSGSAGW